MQLLANPKDARKRLDVYLQEQLPGYSRSVIQTWIKSEHVLVNGAPARSSKLLNGDEEITVTPVGRPPLRAEAEDLPLTILYQDDDLVVVDKPAGMVVHAGAGHARGTLVNALLHHFGALSTLNGEERPGIVHRLDRDTSGALLVARNDRAHRALAKQFHDRAVRKVYQALVQGRMRQPAGNINTPIVRDPVRRTRMTTKLGRGKTALTGYHLLEEMRGPASLLQVDLGTGRTHQIRVHLASIGHPVVGDRLYGAAAVPALNRFFLHASELTFYSPSTDKSITVVSPLAPELKQYLSSLH